MKIVLLGQSGAFLRMRVTGSHAWLLDLLSLVYTLIDILSQGRVVICSSFASVFSER